MQNSIRFRMGRGLAIRAPMLTSCFRIIFASALVVISSYFSGCLIMAPKWKYVQLNRVKSPDGEVEAVIVNGSAGATTAIAYPVEVRLEQTSSRLLCASDG
jgi:hypothetical protein